MFYPPPPHQSEMDKFDTKFSPTRTQALLYRRPFWEKDEQQESRFWQNKLAKNLNKFYILMERKDQRKYRLQ